MKRKTSDPKLVALLDQQADAGERVERCYRRFKRAFTALDAARQRLRRLTSRIEKRRTELDAM